MEQYQERFNAYRIMWLLVFFDLPTETKQDKDQYVKFRKRLLSNGFAMFQFSIYVRHCPSRENADAHADRIRKGLPPRGCVGILCITDKQFGMMELFHGTKEVDLPPPPQQLELF